MYNVHINTHAQREIKKLSKDVQSKLAPGLRSISGHPRLAHLKKLKGSKNSWRLRVGDYRILYEANESTHEIIIYSVVPRKDAY